MKRKRLQFNENEDNTCKTMENKSLREQKAKKLKQNACKLSHNDSKLKIEKKKEVTK